MVIFFKFVTLEKIWHVLAPVLTNYSNAVEVIKGMNRTGV